MNRSALNSTPLGSGNPTSRVLAFISATLHLAGSLTTGFNHYLQAYSEVALVGAVKVTRLASAALSGVLSLVGTSAAGIRFAVGIVLSGTGALVGSITPVVLSVTPVAVYRRLQLTTSISAGRWKSPAVPTQAVQLIGGLQVTHSRIVTRSVSGSVSLLGHLSGRDVPTDLAPVDRTIDVQSDGRIIDIGD